MTLPANFGFVWKKLVAGSAHPGSGRELVDNLAGLREAGIAAIVSLTEDPLEIAPLREFGMDYFHLPIEDFSAPTQQQVLEAVQLMQANVDRGTGVLVHCRAGIGRTGTILACFLVHSGMGAEEAIREVRRLRPGSVEVYAQENCVYQFARLLKEHPQSGEMG